MRYGDFQLDQGAGVWDWNGLFVVLGLEWTQQYLSLLGLPASGGPRLRRIARAFVERLAELAALHPGRAGENPLGSEELLEETFARIEDEIDPAAARRVHFLGSFDKHSLNFSGEWPFLFGAFARGPGKAVPLPLTGVKELMVCEAIVGNFGSLLDLSEDDFERYPEDVEHCARFTVPLPDDRAPIDAVSELHGLLTNLAVYETWREIYATLDSKDLRRLLVWASRQARAIGWPPHLRLPQLPNHDDAPAQT